MRSGETSQVVGWKILLCGCALMLVGATIGRQIQLENSANALATSKAAREFIPLIPVAMGALLAFLGATRLALTARPAYLLPLGLFLDVAAHLIPVTADRVFPATSIGRWSLLSLLPLYALQVVGLIVVSVSFLRLLIRMGQRRSAGN